MRRPLLRRFPVPALLALLATAACAHVAPSGDSMSSQVILADEIQRSRAVTAYDAIAKLRHNFLSDRGKTSLLDRSAPSVPNVYVDGMLYGPLASLHNLPAD